MARGWESKSVEAQIDMAEARRKGGGPPPPAPGVMDRLRQRESLQLSRVRIQRDLETASNPRYRELLRRTLADLDARLAQG